MKTRDEPCFDHDALLYQNFYSAYGSITLYSSFFQIKKRQVPFEFRRVKVVLRTWPFVYTTSLRSIPARRKFSAWARSFLFIRHYSGNHRYFLFPPLIKMLQFSGLLLFKLKYKNKYEVIRVFLFFKFIILNYKS